MLNKIKSLPLFYKIYFCCIIVFIILLSVTLFLLSSFISDYNKGIPETVSKQFFNDTFVKLDTGTLLEMSKIEPCEFETAGDIENSLKNILASNLTYTSVSSDGNEKKYIVKAGDYKCASFSLTPDKNGDYHPASLSLFLPKKASKVYKILDTSSLYINGKKVGDEYIISREEHISAKYLPENVKKPEWVLYSVDGLTKEPEATIVDRNGNAASFIEEDGILKEDIVYDPEETEIIDRIVKGAEQYAICMQDDAPKSSVYPYFERGTDLYSSISTVLNIFVWDHSSYAIEDEKVTEFFRYDENTVSLRVSFTHVLKMYGQEDYRDITDITYYARNVDGVYLIFARHNNI
ncbi:MAG: hypothetical protein IJW06_06835 [Clostridia bacterium]|nr:hypothetical protein [Clostridia bacterium]